jgi:hypothetical protein
MHFSPSSVVLPFLGGQISPKYAFSGQLGAPLGVKQSGRLTLNQTLCDLRMLVYILATFHNDSLVYFVPSNGLLPKKELSKPLTTGTLGNVIVVIEAMATAHMSVITFS